MRGLNGRHFSTSNFYCTKCGQKGIDILRKQSRKRKSGHLKKLYCPWCRHEYNHVEVRSQEDLEIFQANYSIGLYQEEVEKSEQMFAEIN